MQIFIGETSDTLLLDRVLYENIIFSFSTLSSSKSIYHLFH